MNLNLLFFYINVRKINVNLINLKGAGGGGGVPDTPQGKFELI